MDKHNKMLIDATHPEETRVVVLRNGRVEEFDYESAARKLLRGNIYLAKVTRVEPSLQAAFVDYGGNRHGFLAFNEIHPDYYQIPVADREALKQEEAEEEARAEAEADERAHQRSRRRGGRNGGSGHHYRNERPAHAETGPDAPEAFDAADSVSPSSEHGHGDYEPHESDRRVNTEAMDNGDRPPREEQTVSSGEDGPQIAALESVPDYVRRDEPSADERGEALAPDEVADAPEPVGNVEDIGVIEVDSNGGDGNGDGDAEQVEQVTTEEDALEELPERPRRRARQYKIQEVIKRRQIILVQVVKEERGNKGAALTTYISLAGRYTVLMPNTGRGGGISRKITQPQDRKRLKAIAEELDVPEGMGLIIRTAGAARTKQEIKRDYEYLLRLWESVRELTLTSTAPCLVYEEGNLIKRSIRDLYSKDIDQVVVAGDIAYHEAHDFMGMLMPGHADNVIRYDAAEPLFTRFGIERQLNAMFSPYVTLRSGGYLVINQTEALVAIDVNSGKSTREFSIEETALNTNMEAAEEIARQLKLRDLAGLIVVDFIDMEEKRNNRSVERRLKDALRHDRARIQIGRISHFGLLEMSRQRLRTGVLEGSTSQCPHCQGTGIIRSTESVALAVLRGLEDQLLRQPGSLVATTTAGVALYILNHKRPFILDMEERHGISVAVEASDRMQGANFSIERVAAPTAQAKPTGRAAVSMDWGFDGEAEVEEEVEEVEAHAGNGHSHDHRQDHRQEAPAEGSGEQRGRRRRRRRGRRDREGGPGTVYAHDAGEARVYESEAVETAEPAGSYADDGTPEYVAGDAEYEPVAEIAADAGPESSEARGPRAEGENGERRRRGRRRGRRGGRGRVHEGTGGPGEAGASPFVGGPIDEAGAVEGSYGFAAHAADAPIEHREHAAWDTAPSAEPNVQRISIVETARGHEPVMEAISRQSIIETVEAHATQHERAEPVRVVEYSEPEPKTEAAVEATAAEAPPTAIAAQAEPAPLAGEPVQVAEMRVPEDRAPAQEPTPPAAAAEPAPPPAPEVAPEPVVETPPSPPRRGWWQRRFGG